MSESKARYREFCKTEYAPLQFQPWWLDAVCGKNAWGAALCTDGGGRIVAVMPWFRAHRAGFEVLQLPPFSSYGGPWLQYPEEADFKRASRYSFEHKVMNDLINQLPSFDFFVQHFHPDIQNWLPFYWAGFRQTTRYTYVFDGIENMDDALAGMKNTVRTDLKKAEKVAAVSIEPDNWEPIFDLNRKSFNRKNRKHPYNKQIFKQLHQALHTRAQCLCLLARDRTDGRPHAGLYLAFDQKTASVILSGTDPAFKASCAVYLLFREALAFCAKHSLSLDLEGSMDPGIEHTFRSFGARQQPYFRITKARNRLLNLIYFLKSPH